MVYLWGLDPASSTALRGPRTWNAYLGLPCCAFDPKELWAGYCTSQENKKQEMGISQGYLVQPLGKMSLKGSFLVD